VLESHQSEVVNELKKECFSDDTMVFTDKSTSCVDISDLVELHVTEKSNAKTPKILQ
jgi:hypothetical protein